jgi:carbamate kinase
VIDKDLSSALLATALGAEQFVISTSVCRVCLDFATPQQRPVDRLPAEEARQHLADGQFGEGSMAPKIRAVLRYLDQGGREAVITCPQELEAAVERRAGTRITAQR